MTRTDRILAIVLELQAKTWLRAEDLAAIFETSKRTIYRDIQALSQAGVPIVALPGQGYSLAEGYFLPPLNFTTGEASMLLLGSRFIAQNMDEEFRSAALSASRKIEALLPEPLRHEVDGLQDSLHFVAMNTLADPQKARNLQQIRLAVLTRKTIRFEYEARFGSRETRTVGPYRLTLVEYVWYLAGYDHQRQDLRNFRLERIEGPILLPESFKRDPRLTARLEQIQDVNIGIWRLT